ncbi:MAG: ATP-dependent zinc metalloprotease FtsH, partial [Oscillospiraceae bacterium]|nr:ATP-dependent zinc metalloprotease FtsH [Oscillospiraceae bacterium]
MKPQRNRARDLGFYVLLLVIMVAVIFTMTRDSGGAEVENYSDLVDLFKNEKVQSFKTEGNTIILRVRTDDAENPTEEMTYDLYSFSLFYEDFGEMIWDQYESGVIEEYDYNEGFVVPWWASILPYLLLMGGAMVLWYVMMNRMGGGAGGVAKFSKARTRLGSEEKNKKTFADVAGCDEEKEELAEIVDFLKDPKAYTAMGARIPKGVLLVIMVAVIFTMTRDSGGA